MIGLQFIKLSRRKLPLFVVVLFFNTAIKNTNLMYCANVNFKNYKNMFAFLPPEVVQNHVVSHHFSKYKRSGFYVGEDHTFFFYYFMGT